MRYRVSLVSYVNTLPFVYGLRNNLNIRDKLEIKDIYPSKCAQNFIENKADIALVPVGSLADLPKHKVISDYCIGADGAVDTVLLLSDQKMDSLRNIYLDYQSVTSNKLLKILIKYYWKIEVNYKNSLKESNYESEIRGLTGGLVIGDRAFELSKAKKYNYDLAKAWKQWTGLPFVFAVWVAKKEVEEDFLNLFSESLRFGLENINNAIELVDIKNRATVLDYISSKISYRFDGNKKRGLEKFLSFDKLKKL